MRLPFPVHIPLWVATGFALLLFGLQIFQGTSLLFAICCFLFIVIATLAFNLAGGFSRTSGAYVFSYAVLTVIVGLIWKAFLGEPADSNLLVPQRTIQVFLGGITAMLGAVYISRKLTSRRALLENIVTEENMQNATVGCMVTGLALMVIFTVGETSSGTFLSAISQINRFLPMAVILGVVHQIRKSGGRSSMSLPVVIAGGAIFAQGIMGFSKEGMFMPLACWVIAAASQRYKLSLLHVAGGIAAVAFMVIFLVPYSQYGRNIPTPEMSFSDRLSTVTHLLSNLGEVRQEYKEDEEGASPDKRGYFNTPQGFFDRLEMISVDDSLIEVTDRKGPYGYFPIIFGFENLVPHVFWPKKPTIMFGAIYAQEIGGIIPEDDYTTGISFSPSGESYHLDQWTCVFLVAPALWIMLFTLFDSLCGDTRASPWGLLIVAYFIHSAPEGGLASTIWAMSYGVFSLFAAALSAAYLMPIVGTLIKGPENTLVLRAPWASRISQNVRVVHPSRDITP